MIESVLIPEVWKVIEVTQENEDVTNLLVESPQGAIRIEPGQFNMIGVFGRGEVPISVSGNGARTNQIVHSIRDVGAATHALCRLKPGDEISVRGPFGRGWPVQQQVGKNLVFVAGGLGLAPLKPAITWAIEHQDQFASLHLLYGAREPEQVLFQRELKEWGGNSKLNIQLTVDRGNSAWKGNVGVVTQLLGSLGIDSGDWSSLVCGPEIMMRFVCLDLESQGMNPENIYLSMERNMKCAIGHCGHCQYGPSFICKDGPIYSFPQIATWFGRVGI